MNEVDVDREKRIKPVELIKLTYLLFFVILQLVHQFTSNAKTMDWYTVKNIKKLKII